MGLVQQIIGASDEWLGQVHRGSDDANDGEIVPMPDDVFSHPSAVAASHAVAADVAHLRRVVVTLSMGPSQLAVEKPCQVCAA